MRHRSLAGAWVCVAALATAAAPASAALPAGTTALVSRPDGGDLATGLVNASDAHQDRAISADGRYVTFASYADGLLGKADGFAQVFRRDRVTNTTVLVSRTPAGAPGDANSFEPTISDDGTRVAFVTEASDLVPGVVSTAQFQIYVRDLAAGTTTLVSRATDTGTPGAVGNGTSNAAVISRDGSAVAFVSEATNLDPADVSNARSVLVRDLSALPHTTTLVSRANGLVGASASGASGGVSISGDGDVVAFTSQTDDLGDPTVADANGQSDVFVRDVPGGLTRLVSRISNDGASDPVGAFGSSQPSLSSDGDTVAFVSEGNLSSSATLDANGEEDVWRRTGAFSGAAGSTFLVSRPDGAGGTTGAARSQRPSIAADGASVAFVSGAALVAGDANGADDVLLRSGLSTTLLTRAPSGAIAEPGAPLDVSLSGDGTAVLFSAAGEDLSTRDDDDFRGIYVAAVAGPPVEHASRPSGSDEAVFEGGVNTASTTGSGSVSADGRLVVFASGADALSGEDDDRFTNVFVRDLGLGRTSLVSRAAGGPAVGDSFAGVISADGRRVAFSTEAALDPADTNGLEDVYVRDLAAGTTRLVSRAPGADGAAGNADASLGGIDGDGSRVGFVTAATNLGEGDDADTDGFVRDLDTGETILVTRATGPAGVSANLNAAGMLLNGDGTLAVFGTTAANLADGDVDASNDVHLRDLAAGTTTLISRADGNAGPNSDGSATPAGISADGNRIGFTSTATNLDDDTSSTQSVFVRDRAAQTTRLVSRATGPAGASAAQYAQGGAISADGRRVAFTTFQGDLTGEAPAADAQYYLRDLATTETTLVSRTDGPGGAPMPHEETIGPVGLSGDGRCVVFSTATPLVAGGYATRDFRQVYVRAVDGECGVVPPPAPGPGEGGLPGTPGAPAPGLPGAAKDTVRPVVSRFTMLRRTFAVARAATPLTAAARRGSAFRFRLSEAATVRIAIARELSGRRSGRRCVKPTRRLRRAKRCTRLQVRGTLRRSARAGANSTTFTGRLGRRALPRGRHRATLVATDAAGNRSAARVVRFRIVRG